jgi:hypothetical protein
MVSRELLVDVAGVRNDELDESVASTTVVVVVAVDGMDGGACEGGGEGVLAESLALLRFFSAAN